MNRTGSFIVGIAGVAAGSILCILKSAYDHPRPFYVTDLKPFKCRFEHGNPSGHAMMAIGFYFTLASMIIREYRLNFLMKAFVWVACLILAFLIGFARINNGVHTYN